MNFQERDDMPWLRFGDPAVSLLSSFVPFVPFVANLLIPNDEQQ